jgi:glycosyltransferase involved in cell wall biosynthesis
MRIGFVYPTLRQRGGAQNLTVWLAAELSARGHTVALLAAGIDRSLWPELDGSDVVTKELPDTDEGFWHQWHRSRANGRALASAVAGFDLVVAGNYPCYHWLADAVERLERPPATMFYCQEPYRKFYFPITDRPSVEYIQSGRHTLPLQDLLASRVRWRLRKFRFLKGTLVRRFDRRSMTRIGTIVANSEFTRTNAAEAWGREVSVCYPGPPSPDPDTQATAPTCSGVAVLTGWELTKNPMGVLGAIDRVVNWHGRPDIGFTMTGGEPPPPYAAYIEQHGLDRVIDFPGFVSEEEKSRLLASARLCLFIPLAEPFGLVPVEAMLRGTPVVASDHGGPSEVVTHGETGCLVDPYSPDAVADAIVRLYDDVDRLDAMGRQGRVRAETNFSLAGCADCIEETASFTVQPR